MLTNAYTVFSQTVNSAARDTMTWWMDCLFRTPSCRMEPMWPSSSSVRLTPSRDLRSMSSYSLCALSGM